VTIEPDISALLCCPDCHTPFSGDDTCSSCGYSPDTLDGVPSLFPSGPLELLLKLSADSTNPNCIDRSVFRTPERHGQKGTPVYHLDAAHVERISDLPEGAVVLETGCGGAQMRAWTGEKGLNYLGTDVSVSRVHDWLQTHGGADVICDAHALPIRDECVDAIYASAVYEHLAFPHLAAAEAFRVLKRGGLHLGSMSFLEPWHDESYAHMTPNGVYSMLTSVGLEPVCIWPEEAWPGFVSLLMMGNKATRPLRPLGRFLNAYYLLPRKLKHAIRTRRWPQADDLYEPRAIMSGAIAWIAAKPK
jgi:ubiquinone/menaquinone biosynthesis C-methylase UbiE